VIAVVSIVQGFQYMVNQEFQGVGATYVNVQVDRGNPFQGERVARQVKLTWDDGKALREHVAGISQITPVVAQVGSIKYRDLNHRTLVLGVSGDYQDVTNHAVEEGRFISAIDLTHRRKVAVVGQKVVEELELGRDPVGKKIYVGNIPATIIGVMEDKGQVLGQDRNDMVFIPFDLALTLFGRHVGDQVELHIKAATAEGVAEVKDGIQRVLRQRHRIGPDQRDDFRVIKQDELLNSINKVFGGITAVVGGVVGIALLVGGIGIMNIMLVSVTERTREIGVRKAVGAKRQDVLMQFLIEAVTLSLVGGGIGLALGYGMGALLSAVLPGDLPPAHVPLWAVLLAFGFSTMVGIFFGIYPASKAARLDPIDALRYE
jgi:putative ABC transport system permease protein